MTNEDYIKHEVEIRVLSQVTDSRMKRLEQYINEVRRAVHWILGVGVTAILIPIALKFIN